MMKEMNRRLLALAVVVWLSSTGAWAATPVHPSPHLDEVPAGTRLSRHAGTGLVRFLAAPDGRVFANQLVGTLGVGAQARARSFLAVYGGAFGLSDQAKELAYKAENRFAGRTSVRFEQRYGGLPVIGGELVVNLDNDGNVVSANGETVPAAGLATVPTVTAHEATQIAVQTIADSRHVASESLVATEPALWIYNPTVFTPGEFENHLVWRLDVTSSAAQFKELVLVDAQAGDVLLHFDRIDNVRDRKTYTMIDWPPPPGNLVCDENDPTCSSGDEDARYAHIYAGDFYDYYYLRFGRDSIDGAGMTIVSTVHYGLYGYAWWDGSQVGYAGGWSWSDDIVGHELTHGVTEMTCNLFPWMESGAISESLSDVHGELIDLSNGKGTDTPATRWQIGEDLPDENPPQRDFHRDLSDPPKFFDPDKISSPYYYAGTLDNGGIHWNSGVNSKAAFLMTDGGRFNKHTVVGLGLDKVAQLYYDVQVNYLTSASNYVDLYDALLASCTALATAGVAGFIPADCKQVRSALNAVEMSKLPAQHAVDDSNGAFTWTGSWSVEADTNAQYGKHHVSTQVGDTARIPFNGSRLSFHFIPLSGDGRVELFVDGEKKACVNVSDSYNPWEIRGEYQLSGITDSNHVLVIRHASGGPVSVDALVIRQPVVKLPAFPKAVFNAGVGFYAKGLPWVKYSGYWWLNDQHNMVHSFKQGDSLTFSFIGERYRVEYWGCSNYLDQQEFQIFVDGVLSKTVDTRIAPYGCDWYSVGNRNKPLPRGKHKVTVKHYTGGYLGILTVAASDSEAH